jgi:hypothetical protein
MDIMIRHVCGRVNLYSGQKGFQVDKITDFSIIECGKVNWFVTSTAARWPEEVFGRLQGG